MYKFSDLSLLKKMSGLFILSLFMLLSFVSLATPPLLTPRGLSVPPPRIIRTCCAFGAELSYGGIPFMKRTDIIGAGEIGAHHYLGGKSESNGIIYTRRGGFIDIGHMRDCADWTAYLYSVIIHNQKLNEKSKMFLGMEGGTKKLTITIPPLIDSLMVYQLAGKIAYDLSLWHEIATWFGASSIPLIPERYSSFSPEDLYSNLLGVILSIKALKSELPYEEAMTLIVANTLDSLEHLPGAAETYAAMEKVENIWWTNEKSLPSKNILLKRYFAPDSDFIAWFVPGYESKLLPFKLTKPDVKLSDYYQLKIRLNLKFPVKSVFESLNNRTITQKDFDLLISHIVQDISKLDNKTAYHLLKTKKRVERKHFKTPVEKG